MLLLLLLWRQMSPPINNKKHVRDKEFALSQIRLSLYSLQCRLKFEQTFKKKLVKCNFSHLI